jgi:hypothetical protein
MGKLFSGQTLVVVLLIVIALHVRAAFEYDGFAKNRILTKAK